MSDVDAVRHLDDAVVVERVRPGSLELKGRATLTWSHELPLQQKVEVYGDRLPPGSACLNRFPIINLEKPTAEESGDGPEGAHELDLQEDTPEMNAVCALLLATIEAVGGDAPGSQMFTEDMQSDEGDDGMLPTYALILARDEAANDVAMQILKRFPRLMLQETRSERFEGENCLHVTALNRKEAMLESMIDLAMESLNKQVDLIHGASSSPSNPHPNPNPNPNPHPNLGLTQTRTLTFPSPNLNPAGLDPPLPRALTWRIARDAPHLLLWGYASRLHGVLWNVPRVDQGTVLHMQA